jgi:two-component system sensor histidine kinase KdpD
MRGGVRHFARGWHGYAVAAVAVAAITALIGTVSAHATLPTISSLYLLVVLGVASAYGRGPAVAAALAAFLADDFFFVGPPDAFTIVDPGAALADWLTLMVLLVAALVTGQVAARARRRTEEAARRAREIALLHEVSDAMGGAEGDLDGALAVAAARITAALDWVWWTAARLDDPAGDAPRAAPDREGAGIGAAGGPPLVLPIRAGEQRLGTLELCPAPDAAPPTGADRRLLATLAAQLGVTVERERLRGLAADAAALRRADALKSALLAAVSHDLRTPLAAIIATAGNLREEDVAWTARERHDFAAAIEAEARRLDRLVTNLLDVSRIEAGGLRPRLGWYDLGALVDEVLGHTRSLLAGHRLVVAVEDDLPPLALDYVQIAQVLVNLLENATKYAPAGTTVRLGACRVADEVVVAVRDEGPGVPAGAGDRLFAPFYRAGEPGGGPHGTGLGLAVARGFVAAHGGRIWAANRPGGGACFAFALPLAPPGTTQQAEGGAR